MAKEAISEQEFIALFRELGPSGAAKHLGIGVRAVLSRRCRIEKNSGIELASPVLAGNLPNTKTYSSMYPKRLPLEIDNGIVIVGSDAHYWPGLYSTAHLAFVKLIKELQPAAVILNGDVFDGARLSRHPRIGWAQTPTTKQEIEACLEFTTQIEDAHKSAERIWTLGNHDARFENYLSANSSEMEGVPGSTLKDQFPRWQHCISSWINADVVVKHRYKGGVHATHNNTVNAGKTIVTGHLHSLKVTPFDDYNGTRWGVDTGCLMDPYGPQADYTEDNPLNHRSGFIVLTFYRGQLLQPEVVRVMAPNAVDFRGQVIKV